MKKLFFLIALVFLFCRCDDDRTLVIEGKLRTDRDFNGEWLYLLPTDGNKLIRDSALMKDGQFTFTKKADSVYIAMIRPKNAVLTYFLQPLLVAVEPGILTVRLDSVSLGKGTPLNDVLQGWKEKKTSHDLFINNLRRQVRKADDAEKAELEAQLKQSEAEYSDYNYNFVRENKDNPIGRFVYNLTKSLLTEEQKETLAMPSE